MKRNKHNLSHYKLFSADMGMLYPISCFEALPGDTIQMSSSVFLRFAPMLAPVIHPIKVGIYTFQVPLRLLWENFEAFITGGPDGLDSHTPPVVKKTGGVQAGSLADYLGVPVGYEGYFSKLPIRAYYRIYNEYFRDQDLQDPIPEGEATEDSIGTSGSNSTFPDIAPVSWEKDYFTVCRPWPQKGATVTIPVNSGGSSGSISISGNANVYCEHEGPVNGPVQSTENTGNNKPVGVAMTADGETTVYPLKVNGSTFTATASGSGGIGSVRLDDLREAFALQRFEEHRAAYGSRYTEYLRYLGVRSSDARLQRPEYLGGGKTTMQISEVLQTAADGDSPVGTLRGHGIGAVSSRTFRRFIEEHSYIMTLLKVQPVAIYEQGLHKMFSRKTKEDFWQKELEHIGQQEVKTRELYAFADEDTLFGYNNRYDEYRGIPSTVAGEMRSLLDFWHMARNFANEPVLNSSFIAGSPTKRIFAEQTQNEIYCLAQHKVVARRFLSKQGNPIL